MSYWIDVPCPPANAPADANFLLPVFHATGLADLRPVDGIASLQAWPGKSVQMYRDLRSCRSVEIEVPPERTSVRIIIRAMPSAVDRDLAIALALACAEKLGSSTVKPEMFDALPPHGLTELLDNAWLHAQQESGAFIMSRLVAEQGGMVMPGPIRPWHVGPRILGELQSAGSEPLHSRMLQQMHRVQWIDRTDGYTAATPLIEKGDPNQTLAIWQPRLRSLIPDAVRIVIGYEPNGLIVLPHESFVRLAGSRLTWLDERQTLVEPFTDADFDDLLARAKPLDISRSTREQRNSAAAPATAAAAPAATAAPQPASPDKPKKWWNVWS